MGKWIKLEGRVCVQCPEDVRVRFVLRAARPRWFDALEGTGKVEVYLWKPEQFDEIVECLR